MTNTKIIDTHFHIWNLEKQNLPWLEDVDDKIKKTFTIDDYLENYEKHEDIDFLGGVYVEVDGADPINEDGIIYDIKKENPKILATMLRSKVSPIMRVPVFGDGIREPLHTDDAPKGRCLEESFIEGLKVLSDNDMFFESCNRVEELEDLVKTLEKVPEGKVVLNHLGNVESLDDDYKNAMKKLAKFENVYVKVSGFPTKDKAFVKELLDFITETFRHDRLLYASNWPVVELYSNFDEHLKILRDYFKDDPEFFYKNAIRCYGLDIR